MTARVPDWVAPATARIREQFDWLPKVLRLVAVPAMALLWLALAFLPWTRARLPVRPAGLRGLGVGDAGPRG
ncbi:MAG: hypothetical protein ACYDC9_02465 [Dermatophilaceae bacterium]